MRQLGMRLTLPDLRSPPLMLCLGLRLNSLLTLLTAVQPYRRCDAGFYRACRPPAAGGHAILRRVHPLHAGPSRRLQGSEEVFCLWAEIPCQRIRGWSRRDQEEPYQQAAASVDGKEQSVPPITARRTGRWERGACGTFSLQLAPAAFRQVLAFFGMITHNQQCDRRSLPSQGRQEAPRRP